MRLIAGMTYFLCVLTLIQKYIRLCMLSIIALSVSRLYNAFYHITPGSQSGIRNTQEKIDRLKLETGPIS